MTLFSSMNIISFQGELTYEIIEGLLQLANEKLSSMELDLIVQKRLYSILVESLENSVRHKSNDAIKTNHQPLEMELFLRGNQFILKIGNYIKPENTEWLTKKIDEVNSLDREGLNQMYRSSIAKARISDKGGAGLGIIDIARNSGQKIKYTIENENAECAFFTFEMTLLNNASK
jgi:hypothetical protein